MESSSIATRQDAAPDSPMSNDPVSNDAPLRALQRLEVLVNVAAEEHRPRREERKAKSLVSVVIPVYNERDTIRDVVERVLSLPIPTEVIVVDDCSTDGTDDVLQRLAASMPLVVMRHPMNRGKGAALRTGFGRASGDVVLVQDADLEYDPAEIPKLIEPLLNEQAEVVYGSRYLGATSDDPSRLHRWGNRVLTGFSNWCTGQNLTDMETCYKAFRREVLDEITIEEDRFGVEPELTAKVAARGCRVREIPISYQGRGYAQGKKIGLRDAVAAFYCILKYSWRS